MKGSSSQASFPFAACVLAGGLSRRMGRDKASLEFGCSTLLEHQLATLRELQPEQLLVSTRPGADYGAIDPTVVYDRYPDCGPMAGIEAALANSSQPAVLVLAVDLPDMSAPFLRRLLQRAASRGNGIVPKNGDYWEPLAAVYPRSLLPTFQASLQNQSYALQAVLDKVAAQGKVEAYHLARADRTLFRNINFPQDLP